MTEKLILQHIKGKEMSWLKLANEINIPSEKAKVYFRRLVKRRILIADRRSSPYTVKLA